LGIADYFIICGGALAGIFLSARGKEYEGEKYN
jgi:hypothetical protein